MSSTVMDEFPTDGLPWISHGESPLHQGALLAADDGGVIRFMGRDTTDRGSQPRTLAEKLDHLFTTVHPPGRQHTHEEVATALREAGGPTISATYVWQLRTGRRDNPTKRHLEALAAFFGVPVNYFFDDEAAAQIDSELDLLVALRDTGVRQLALRTLELSPEARQMVADLVEHAARLDQTRTDRPLRNPLGDS